MAAAEVSLDGIPEQQKKLAKALVTVNEQVATLVAEIRAGGQAASEEQHLRMSILRSAIQKINDRQLKLQHALDGHQAKLGAEQRAQSAAKARSVVAVKEPEHIRMEDMRNLNKVDLDADDKEERFNAAQKTPPVLPSGGMAGFRVATDLLKMDFSYMKPVAEKNWWTGVNSE